jgi:hypothetical protein
MNLGPTTSDVCPCGHSVWKHPQGACTWCECKAYGWADTDPYAAILAQQKAVVDRMDAQAPSDLPVPTTVRSIGWLPTDPSTPDWAERDRVRRANRPTPSRWSGFWSWFRLIWGAVAILAAARGAWEGQWMIAATQAVIAVVCLIVWPTVRAYRRRKAYHRELAERADRALYGYAEGRDVE